MTYQTIATIYVTGVLLVFWFNWVMYSLEEDEDVREQVTAGVVVGMSVFWPVFVVVMSIGAWMSEGDSDGTV